MARPLFQQLQKAGIRTPMARAPYLLTATKRQDLNELLLLLARESIRVCKEAGCESILIEPLFSGVDKGREWAVNQEFYLSLVPLAREHGVKILLKNQCRDMDGHLIRGVCSHAGEAVSWIDQLNAQAGEERFAFCMDTGICTLCGQNMREFSLTLGHRIQAVILRDLDGSRESSRLPFTYSGFERSGTDWLGLIRGLREIGFDGSLILDFSTTAAAFSPLLRPQVLQLARAVGEYFKWQIGMETLLKKYKSRVLFGAGNMCRNYMKCYGDKYPPLFTCDNNEKLWGTRFCGLEVKAPESLRELPSDCAVFICNIYYREIQAQLRQMGLENPVEYFSDEFMPSFYFDRLES
ncbi:MAG: sugar phosphate isomerase/epimerase [Lachnospiraceae bacterium]|nr:sugar phosphate isomerase/epimerase [Lachnospiraceae bacterium]